MRKITLASTTIFGAMVALSLHAAPTQAATLTWVANFGSDLSVCSRAAPCATFQAAHDATTPGGEINCVDAGSYGPVNINKSISIVCDNTQATIMATGDGVNIAAGVSDIVTLKGLNIEGTGATARGILFQIGAALHVHKVQIRGFRGAQGIGILFSPGTYAELYVADSYITDNGTNSPFGGIQIAPLSTASVNAFINRVRLENNTTGIFVDGRSSTGAAVNAIVLDSTIIGSTSEGITAATGAGHAGVSILVDHSVVSGNFMNGILATGTGAVVRIGDSTIALNVTGVLAAGGGVVQSFKNNRISGNLTDGTPIPAFPGPGGSAQQ